MRALVTAGQGYGNLVMATPTITAVASMGFEVDIWIRPHLQDSYTLIEGWEIVRHVYTKEPEFGYDAVVGTVWHRGNPRWGPAYNPSNRNLRKTHEVLANIEAAHSLGYVELSPKAHVEFDVAPEDRRGRHP